MKIGLIKCLCLSNIDNKNCMVCKRPFLINESYYLVSYEPTFVCDNIGCVNEFYELIQSVNIA